MYYKLIGNKNWILNQRYWFLSIKIKNCLQKNYLFMLKIQKSYYFKDNFWDFTIYLDNLKYVFIQINLIDLVLMYAAASKNNLLYKINDIFLCFRIVYFILLKKCGYD